jgi:RHS repeat-associated protein
MTAAQVRVTTADQRTAQAAGVHGVLFSLRSTGNAGSVGVEVDASAFRDAYGGDYASRLRLVRLPACALTTPRLSQCQTQTPVRTVPGASLSTQVALPQGSSTPSAASSVQGVPSGVRSGSSSAPGGIVVLAVTSGTSGSSGDYSATGLSAGGTWSVGGNTGSFGYSYPIVVPPAIGGAAPNVGLSYDSSSQDARTEGTNNQSSWLGDGWSTSDNYIERTYTSCQDDSSSGAPANDGDQCWAGQVLTLSLNGKSTPIVYDDATKSFHSVQDDSTTKIENLTGTTNGTTNGEYFKVTENGTQYFFGMNRLPGWASGNEETQSAWTAPVYKANGGVSACPAGTDFASSSCTLGYRFNLDYAVDLHGNATAYYYAPATGYYGADMKNTAVAYTRGGTLKRIDYGMTSSTIYSTTAPEQVLFDATAERCIAGVPAGNTCSDAQFTTSNPNYWPDVPIDLNCTSGAACTNHGPSFWSRKRLTSITTQVQVAGATKQVDRYDFTQSFPDGGDHAPTLWLDSIQHTGLDLLGGATTTASIPSVSFDPPLQLPNRVGTIPQMPVMYHDRIQTVTSETGAQTTVTYSTPNCSSAPASDPADPTDAAAKAFASTNKLWCFPVYWTPYGQPAPMLDWFYLHPVTSVTTIDPNNHNQDGTQPELVTQYAYMGDPGWHYDDNETVKAKNRTWGQFRGFPEVDTTTGDPNVFHNTNGAKVYDQKTLTKAYYFLGMNGDTMPSGTRTVPKLTSHDGSVSVTDDNALAGQAFETDIYTGVGGTIDKAVVAMPTIIGPTASRARTGLPALTAQMVRSAQTLTRQAVSYGWRKTETDTFYNTTLGQTTTGMTVQNDDRGEAGASNNTTQCTFTRYLDGSPATLLVTAEVIVTDQDCNTAGATPSGTLISDARSSFDHNAFAYNGDGQSSPALPSIGDATLVQKAAQATGTTVTRFLDETTSQYDSYGRVALATRTPNSTAPGGSSLAQTTATTYTPTSGALPTAATTSTQITPGATCTPATATSKDCHVTGVSLDAARQVPVTKTDVAGLVTSLTYDALGRLTGVWSPNQNKSIGAPADTTYSYTLSATTPSVVSTNTLLENGSYSTSETLYDAMLRPLQTQTTAENGDTTVSDTQYDSHGWTVLTNNAYAVSGNPASSLVSPSLVSMPDTTVTDHDAMGRPTLATEEHNGGKTWTTSTAYTGDTTTVIPPTGAVATGTTVDARGRTTQLVQYTVAPTLAGSATGGFTASGGTGNPTSYGYNTAGQQNKVTGPDNSVWNIGYDLLGRKTSQKDPDAGSSGYGFDDAGNLVSTTDARGNELDYTYDLAGRKLTETDKKTNFVAASWLYDTIRIGLPTSSTRYVPGVTGGYTVAFTGYTSLDKPGGTKITLPASEAPLPTTYQTTYAYSVTTQLLNSQSDPRTQGLLGETIVYGHDVLGNPTTTSSAGLYVAKTVYTNYNEPSQITLGASTNPATITYSYDDQTRRLTGRLINRTQAPGPQVDNTSYTYDAAGNTLTATDQQSETGNTATDAQCYQYDALARLHQAWTAKTACPQQGTDPTAATVASTAGSYWQTYNYDPIGDRTKVVDHSTTGGADSTTGYTNGCTGGCNATGAQPHTLTATAGGTNPASFVYDTAGNLLTRTPTSGGAGQSLTWDDEGRLAQVATTGSSPTTTKYLYDADGNQLIRRDPGRTTLFAGDTEIVANTSVTPNVLLGAVRTYTHGGSGPAVGVSSSLPGGGTDYLFGDPHGTAQLAMDTTTQQVSRQQYTPYGQQRTSPNTTTWPDATHTYLGQPQDTTTGYTDIGARKYDPTTGHFISIDPLLNVGDPQSLGGYAYADDNPATLSDPSGQCPVDLCGGGEGKGGSTTGEVTQVDQASSVYQDVPWVPMDRDGNVACSDRCQVFPGISVPATKAWKADITKFVHKFYNRYYYNAGMNDPYFVTDWQINNSAAAELQLWLWSACGDTQCPDRGSMLMKALGAGIAVGWGGTGRGGVTGSPAFEHDPYSPTERDKRIDDMWDQYPIRDYGPSELKWESNPKHGQVQRGNAGPEPTDPVASLMRSVAYNPNSTRRVSADPSAGEFAVFDESYPRSGIYHGHVRSWDQLDGDQQNALVRAGMANRRGKILE